MDVFELTGSREELLTKVGKVEAALASLPEMPANTSADIATQEKKRKQAHLKRLLSQDARDEKLEAIEKKRKSERDLIHDPNSVECFGSNLHPTIKKRRLGIIRSTMKRRKLSDLIKRI